MAHFHGTLQGARGEASRLGNKGSGITAVVHSYEGGIQVSMYVEDDKDCVSISVGPHGHESRTTIYAGPLSDLMSEHTRAHFFHEAFKQVVLSA